MEYSRVKHIKRNTIYGVINRCVSTLFPFFIRTVIIHYLGVEYLGIDGLYVSLIQVLNLAELGLSNAIVYSMYEPVARHEVDRLCSIVRYYRHLYRVIGLVIALFGTLLIPFLHMFIKGNIPEGINIYLLYILYLGNTVLSYFLFAYKNAVLIAHQRMDVISNISSFVRVLCYSAQLIVIVFLHNFYAFVILNLIFTVINNLITEYYSGKLFPHIVESGVISVKDKKIIVKSVKGILISKLCQMSRNSFDSIFISSFIGLAITGIYNNYFYVLSGVQTFVGVISASISASVGNSIAIETVEKNYKDMNTINFIYMWISSVCTICLLCLYQPFFRLFFGADMILPETVMYFICLYFYLLRVGDIRSVYVEARGLWWENRYRAIFESLANILLNLILVIKLGVLGVVLATIISLFVFNFLWGSTIIFRHYFVDYRIRDYYLSNLCYFLVTALVGAGFPLERQSPACVL